MQGSLYLICSWRGLLRGYELDQAGIPHHDWRYRYSASGEREQKRLYYSRDAGHSKSDARGWVYYLLGGDKEQLAVYHGQEGCTREKVVMYPVEYNTFAVMYPGIREDIAQITTRPDAASPFGIKEFKIVDHLASTRVIINGSPAVQTFTYGPFRNLLASTAGIANRQGLMGGRRIMRTEHSILVRESSIKGMEGSVVSVHFGKSLEPSHHMYIVIVIL